MATPRAALRSHLRAAVFAVEATTGDRDQPGTLDALTLPRRGSVGRLRRTPTAEPAGLLAESSQKPPLGLQRISSRADSEDERGSASRRTSTTEAPFGQPTIDAYAMQPRLTIGSRDDPEEFYQGRAGRRRRRRQRRKLVKGQTFARLNAMAARMQGRRGVGAGEEASRIWRYDLSFYREVEGAQAASLWLRDKGVVVRPDNEEAKEWADAAGGEAHRRRLLDRSDRSAATLRRWPRESAARRTGHSMSSGGEAAAACHAFLNLVGADGGGKGDGGGPRQAPAIYELVSLDGGGELLRIVRAQKAAGGSVESCWAALDAFLDEAVRFELGGAGEMRAALAAHAAAREEQQRQSARGSSAAAPPSSSAAKKQPDIVRQYGFATAAAAASTTTAAAAAAAAAGTTASGSGAAAPNGDGDGGDGDDDEGDGDGDGGSCAPPWQPRSARATTAASATTARSAKSSGVFDGEGDGEGGDGGGGDGDGDGGDGGGVGSDVTWREVLLHGRGELGETAMHLCFLIYQESHLVLIHFLLERFASAQVLQRRRRPQRDAHERRGGRVHGQLEEIVHGVTSKAAELAGTVKGGLEEIVSQLRENSGAAASSPSPWTPRGDRSSVGLGRSSNGRGSRLDRLSTVTDRRAAPPPDPPQTRDARLRALCGRLSRGVCSPRSCGGGGGVGGGGDASASGRQGSELRETSEVARAHEEAARQRQRQLERGAALLRRWEAVEFVNAAYTNEPYKGEVCLHFASTSPSPTTT